MVALIPIAGLGRRTALIALVAYAQVFLVRNLVTGLRGVDPAIREAARGLGMSPAQQLRRIDLPLALPAILAGVRIAAVSTIGLATLGALINAGGLGTLPFEGVAQDNGARFARGDRGNGVGVVQRGAGAVEERARGERGVGGAMRGEEQWAVEGAGSMSGNRQLAEVPVRGLMRPLHNASRGGSHGGHIRILRCRDPMGM
ncbi:MAG: ABC transporter permease [Ardenticatenia bacterium]|nr:ABC transporter permease [Ardenticatenia bacterium]